MIIGIDLGTTNSLVAVWQDGQAVLIPNSLGQYLTPSVVSVDKDGSILIGQSAKERLISHPQATASMFKRYMGSQKTFVLSSQHRFNPEELSALILKSLKEDAEKYLSCPITEAVITVPAYFNDHQRKATKTAAQLAGLTVSRLLNEPTAAAMAYGFHQLETDSKFLVLDLGGGTFDVTLLELFVGIMEVRASAGNNHLGGEDFTQLLLDSFIAQHSQPLSFWEPYQGLLYGIAERAKRDLTTQEQTTMQLNVEGVAYNWHITREQFGELCQTLFTQFREPIERAIRDANLRVADLDKVIMVGGATRMPVFHRLMARLLGRFPAINLNPDETIAIGAAIQAGLVMGDAALDEVILTDVAPYSLGVASSLQLGNNQYQHGVFSPIIERNTIIPTSKIHTFFAVENQQKAISFQIYQGEARLVKDNIKLGEMTVDIPKAYHGKASELPVEVRFSYDVNGLLEVDIVLQNTDKQYNLVIENGANQLSLEDLAVSKQKLANLKIHPRDQAENRSILARAERLYAQRLGFEREQLNRLIGWYQLTLDSQDPKKILQANAEMLSSLEAFEKNDDWF